MKTIVKTGLKTKKYVAVLLVLNLVSDFVKCYHPIAVVFFVVFFNLEYAATVPREYKKQILKTQDPFCHNVLGAYPPTYSCIRFTETCSAIFELGRQARPGRHTGIRLYRPVQAEGQNKSWGHRLTAKASTY
jgi:hypothetical protein